MPIAILIAEDLEELASLEDPNPLNHDLATVVKRYLGIRMEKAHTKLGGSDWSRTDLSPAHYVYMAEDVGYLPALWTVLEQELREAQLDAPFRERMKFFPHLNQIKMTGIPIDVGRRDADCQKVTAEKASSSRRASGDVPRLPPSDSQIPAQDHQDQGRKRQISTGSRAHTRRI